MATCKLDTSTSPNIRRDIKKLSKKFHDLDDGLKTLITSVESDHTSACHATRLRFPQHPELQGKVWKYDLSCPSLKKHPRESMRLICIFLDDPKKLYAIWCFHRPGNDAILGKDVAPLVAALKHAILNPGTQEDEETDETNVLAPE